MYGQYVAAVIRRALQPTTRVAEAVQVLVAFAAPSVARLAGIKLPPSDNMFTYLGYALAAFVLFRVFFVAPFELWREQVGQIGTFKLELSKPERIEIKRIAKMRAKARLKLAGAIREAQLHIFMYETDTVAFRKAQKKIARTAAFTQMGTNALDALSEVQGIMDRCHLKILEGEECDDQDLGNRVARICGYLHGALVDEDLAIRPPLNDENEPLLI